jgi:bifunctional UDP-N-acetylglucosamine pyrophosphorylase/glucosamine-1-phosphate N-acetyltransferase
MQLSIEGEVESNAYIVGPVGLAKGARIRSGAYIEGPVVIGEGSDIGPNCYIRPYTSIGARVRIGNACEIKNSIIMDKTHIAHLSYVADSIIGEKCNLGAGTITANLRFDERAIKMMIEDKLVDTGQRKLGAIIGDYVKAGVSVCFMPGVKIGAYSWIGPGVVVYRDLSERTFIREEVEYRVEGVRE